MISFSRCICNYDKLKDSAGYQYDLANVLEQILSNTAQEYQKKMSSAFILDAHLLQIPEPLVPSC